MQVRIARARSTWQGFWVGNKLEMVGTTGFGPARLRRSGCPRATLPLRSGPNAPLARSPAMQVRIARARSTWQDFWVGNKLEMVGTTGFEPATSCSQSRRATKLRHVPTQLASRYFNRTRNKFPDSAILLHKCQMLDLKKSFRTTRLRTTKWEICSLTWRLREYCLQFGCRFI